MWPQAVRDDAAVGNGPVDADDEDGAVFADISSAIPKVVFSRTLDSVEGNARLAEASIAEEIAAAMVVVGGGTPFLPPVTRESRWN